NVGWVTSSETSRPSMRQEYYVSKMNGYNENEGVRCALIILRSDCGKVSLEVNPHLRILNIGSNLLRQHHRTLSIYCVAPLVLIALVESFHLRFLSSLFVI